MSDVASTILIARWLILIPPTALLCVSLTAAAAGFVVQSVERQARVPWTRLRLATLARETVARSFFGALRYLPWPQARTPKATEQTPVLLVPCPRWGAPSMAILGHYLRARGIPTWTGALDSPASDLAHQAEILEQHVLRLTSSSQQPQIDLVCHGLGGLAAAWLLRHRTGVVRIRRLVTLGTPWHGTKMAAFLPARAAIEARPGSHHLDELVPPPVSTACVYCPDDPDIVPASSAIVDTTEAIAIEGAGHVGLLVSARSFDAVWQLLERQSTNQS